MDPSHVLVPLDGSPLADAALVHALETYNCGVTVVNVVTPIDAGMSESGVLEGNGEREDTAHRRAERLVDAARTQVEAPDRSIEAVVETGDPADTILEYVDDHDVDMVVMGGHGGDRGELATRLLGTVATRVVAEAPVSVTVIR